MSKILALCGSLRAASYNRALLRAATELAPAGMTVQVYEYADLPVYNEDLGTPESAARLREAIAAADGVLISTPEYNAGIPGGLKNAIDWASRPAFASCLVGKPTGVMSAAGGASGGMGAQGQLRIVLAATLAPVFTAQPIAVGGAHAKFDGGRLADERTLRHLRPWMAKFDAWVEATRSPD